VNQPGFPFARDEFDFATAVQPSSHASKVAAERLKAKGQQGEKARRLLRALLAGDLIDSEIERATGLPRQSICSLRRSAVKRGLVVGVGERMGPYGTPQTVWRLTEQGKAAVR
jgi:hypothetical protein